MNWQGDGFWNGQKQYLVYFWFHLQSGSSGASSSWGIQPPLLEFLPPLLLLPRIFLRLSLGLYFLQILHQNLLLCCSFLISILILFLQLHLPPFPSSPLLLFPLLLLLLRPPPLAAAASNHHRFSDVAPSLVDPIPLLQQISFWVQFGLIFVTFCPTLVTILLVVPPWLQPALHVTWDAEHGDRDRPCLASLQVMMVIMFYNIIPFALVQHHHPHRHLRGVHLQL